jgi:DNA-binding CsgD family transcriptional regulator/PAS domain-containing protein
MEESGITQMSFAERTDQRLADIYGAALNPSLWQQALSRLVADFGGVASRLLLSSSLGERGKGQAYIAGIYTEDLQRLYASYYHALDPRPALLAKLPVGTPMASHHHLDDAFIRHSEFYSDFLIPRGARHSLSCDLIRDTGLHADFCVSRDARQGPFEAEELARFAALMPHFRNAARISAIATHWNTIGRFAVQTLEQLSKGIVITDDRGRVMYMNGAAVRLLAREDGLLLQGNRLVAAKTDESRGLARQIDAAAGAASGKSLPDRIDLAISRLRDRVPYLVTLAPILGEAFASDVRHELPKAAVVVTIIDPRLDNGAAHSRLMMAFRLTKAEAKLGAALLAGKTLSEIATETGLRMPTLRTQLRAVLKKTGTAGQAEFMRIGVLFAASAGGPPLA